MESECRRSRRSIEIASLPSRLLQRTVVVAEILFSYKSAVVPEELRVFGPTCLCIREFSHILLVAVPTLWNGTLGVRHIG